jgi:hypothetical protein
VVRFLDRYVPRTDHGDGDAYPAVQGIAEATIMGRLVEKLPCGEDVPRQR